MRRAGATTAVAVLIAAALTATACSSSSTTNNADGSSRKNGTASTALPIKVEPKGTGACDPTDPTRCLLPFPSDRYTRADPSTPTGRRLDIPADGTPANKAGKHIDPAEWNRNDGFSPSSVGITVVPGLDAGRSALPPQTDIAQSLAPDSPVVVLDVTTGKRVPAWAEFDPKTPRGKRLLRIVPAVGLAEGHRIAIVLRNLKHSDGSDIAPNARYTRLVANPTPYERTWLDALDRAGLAPQSLTLAWSFTVASEQGLSGRLRHMWSETSAALGDGAPPFTVTSTDDSGAARVVRGTFVMPN